MRNELLWYYQKLATTRNQNLHFFFFFFSFSMIFKHSDIKDKFLSYKLFHADIPLFGIMFLFAPPLTGLEAEQT